MKKTVFFQSIIIGDSLALPLEGLSRGHAGSFVREVKDYIDPAQALKTGHHEWRKPALYSSLSQLCLTAALCSAGERFQPREFSRILINAGTLDGTDCGPLRHMERTLQNAIAPALAGRDLIPQGTPSCQLPLIAAAIAVQHSRFFPLDQILDTQSLFCTEPRSMFASIFTSMLFRMMIHDELSLEDALPRALADSRELATGNEPKLFARGFNPTKVNAAAASWSKLIECTGEKAEEAITRVIRPLFPSPVTRATVEHPEAVIALAIAIARTPRRTPDMLSDMLRLGGTLRPLCATALALRALDRGLEDLPQTLMQNMVNRRAIESLLTHIEKTAGGASSATGFLEAETLLTRKSLDEEKLKNTPHKGTAEKPRKSAPRSQEEILSRHVVESWTKIDRARWKKEKQRQESDENDELD